MLEEARVKWEGGMGLEMSGKVFRTVRKQERKWAENK